jgi:hypothetical protein
MTILFSLRWLLLLVLLAGVAWMCWRSLRHDPS